jgi:hypothetical protein
LLAQLEESRKREAELRAKFEEAKKKEQTKPPSSSKKAAKDQNGNKDKPQPTGQAHAKTYKIGDRGPAGGIVFYDKRNTDFIIAILNRRGESGTAAQLCKEYTLNGYKDWFLPSKDELNLLYINLNNIHLRGFSGGWYWSSSQDDYWNSNQVWAQRFSDGSKKFYGKSRMFLVRAVRAF